MKHFLIFDLELGGVEDVDGRVASSIYGITEISFGVISRADDWSRVDMVDKFHSFVIPRPELMYDSAALNVQVAWLEDVYQETFDAAEFEPRPEDLSPHEIDAYDRKDQTPSAADTLYAWLLLNGRDETLVLQKLKQWSEYHWGPDSYKVSAWAHNAPTDMSFLQAACMRCFPDEIDQRYQSNNMMPCNRAHRCSMNLFRVMRDAGLHDRYKADLDTVIAFYGIVVPEEDRHTAKGDLLALATAIGCMLQHIKSGKKFGPQTY